LSESTIKNKVFTDYEELASSIKTENIDPRAECNNKVHGG